MTSVRTDDFPRFGYRAIPLIPWDALAEVASYVTPLDTRSRTHVRPAALTFRLLAAAAVLFLSACAAGSGSHACGPQVADQDFDLPQFQGKLVDGADVDLADYREGTVVLNVWGAWCAPCRVEAPELKKAADALTPAGVRFLGVDVRDSTTAAAAFDAEFAIPYPSVFDDPSQLAADLGATSPPTTFVAHDGVVRSVIRGQTDAATIQCAVDHVTRA